MKKKISIHSLAIGLTFFTLALGCQKTPQPQQDSFSRNNLQTGVHAFDFDPKKVEEISIAKTDPVSAEQWIATFRKGDEGWTISAAPSGMQLEDRVANTGFLNHLVDSLAQFRVTGEAVSGSEDAMNLSPPLFQIRWRTRDQEFQFQLGGVAKKDSDKRYVKLNQKLLLAWGSALPLLDQIQSFQYLRQPTWTLVSPDDIDEIELFRSGKPYFYAQREGDRWTDRKHRPVKVGRISDSEKHHQWIEEALGQLTEGKVQEYVDNPLTKKELELQFQKTDLLEAHLSDRFGKTTVLKFLSRSGKLYGQNSTRPLGLFTLPKTIEDRLQLK
ncbi:MAG: hypothetical protein HYX41_03995 [Bdellovibrio sp.]|nr:hypothetical protein [Bdellovibrio sp.]